MKPSRILVRRRLGPLPELVRTLPAATTDHLGARSSERSRSIGFVLDILGRGRQPATLLALNVSSQIYIGISTVAIKGSATRSS